MTKGGLVAWEWTRARLPALFAVALLCGMAGGCGTAESQPPEGIGVENEALSVIIPGATGASSCSRFKPAGVCPWCGICIWSDHDGQCILNNLNGSGCPCYDGQTEACSGGLTRTCAASSRTSSTWGVCK